MELTPHAQPGEPRLRAGEAGRTTNGNLFDGGGEMGALMRSFEWDATPLGPAACWPHSLKTGVRMLLGCKLPMYIAWGPDFIQLYNDAYRPILGNKHPASLGTAAAATWPEIWSTVGPMFAGVLRGEAVGFDNFKLTIDRFGYEEDCYFNFSYSPMPDDQGNVAGVLVAYTETTQAIQLERRLQQQADQLARLFQHAPVGIAVLHGPDLVYEVANDRYMELVDHREVLGKPIRQALPELAGQGIFELLDTVYSSGKEYVGRLHVKLRRGNPSVLQDCSFELVYHPLADAGGKIDSVVVIAYEVTEAVNAQRAAESANRTKDEFLAMLGHELRNPLAPILTALNIMKLRGITEAEEERLIIERQVRHVVGLVDDLLDVSRVTRGKLLLKKERFELAEAVARAIEQCGPLLEQQQHNLRIQVPATGCLMDADPRRVAQIITNLVHNAAKYTERSGEITVSSRREGEEVAVRVKDNGTGIRPELLPNIFDLFYQEQQSIDRTRGGLGLGLAIVKNLAELHHGRVAAWSEGRGRGSEFTVWLPAAHPEEPVVRAEPAPPESRPANQMRVLIVDDNADAARMLALSLRLRGHVAQFTHDGAEALTVLQTFIPDIAVLDIGLPAMDGYQLAGHIRQRPSLDKTRLVALTGYGQEEDRARSAAAGFDAHLVKPVDVEHFHDFLLSLHESKPPSS